MKKSVVIIAVLALFAIVLVVYGATKGGSSAELETDSIAYNKANGFAKCSIKVEYPVDRTTPLAKAVMDYIAEMIGYEDTKALPQPSEMLRKAGEKSFTELYNMAREVSDDASADCFPYTDETQISKIYESDKVVTFKAETYSYMGGAHGSVGFTPATFTKDTGETLGFSIFKDTNSGKFKQLLKSGLKRYFEVTTDDELKEMLFVVDDINNIPLPDTPPYFTEHGVSIVYSPYEIAPYAAGMPEITINYDEVKPLLTDEAAALIE